MCKWMHERMNEWTDGLINRFMDKWMKEMD